MSADRQYVVSADDYGTVKLFNSPCVVEDAPYHEYTGHSSHVTNIRFVARDRIVSIGGKDGSVVQWKLIQGEDKDGDGVVDVNDLDKIFRISKRRGIGQPWEPKRPWGG